MFNKAFLIVIVSLLWPASAFAYVGPGMGAGALGVIAGLIGSVFLALFSVVYYPLKRWYRKWKGEPEIEQDAEIPAEEGEGNN